MIIAPSVLSLDYSDFKNQLNTLNRTVEWIHFDVMDGHFVPNLTFGPDIQKAFRKNTSLFIDTHLMVSNPEFFADVFINAGSDQITFHYEVYDNDEDCIKLIKKIKNKYVKAGISIKPKTPVSAIKGILPYVDNVLVMSVEPGFGGQKFIENAHAKIKELSRLKKENGYSYHVEVDGGINDQISRSVLLDGADVLVAGSFIFNGNIESNVESLRNTEPKL